MTTAPALPETVVILDVEASGLGPLSWPIEVGVAIVEGDAIAHAEARLIRPHPGWDPAGWTEDSAAVHGIPRAALESAPPPAEVAAWLLDLLAGRRAWSDAPMSDWRWLNELTDAAGLGWGAVRLGDYDRALIAAFGTSERGQEAVRAAWAHFDGIPTPHRAEADARLMAEAYLIGRRVLGENGEG